MSAILSGKSDVLSEFELIKKAKNGDKDAQFYLVCVL